MAISLEPNSKVTRVERSIREANRNSHYDIKWSIFNELKTSIPRIHHLILRNRQKMTQTHNYIPIKIKNSFFFHFFNK